MTKGEGDPYRYVDHDAEDREYIDSLLGRRA